MTESDRSLPITIEFAGGAELLFDKIKKRDILLPPLSVFNSEHGDVWMIRHLLVWMEKNLLKERPELFLQQGSVRPGILVLVNDEDWELIGELDYQLKPKDCVLFISTLHGG